MGTSATRAKDKFNEKTYDRLTVRFKKGEKDRYFKIAESSNKSLNSYIIEALEEKIEKDKKNKSSQ